MIPFHFEYYKPDNVQEALELYQELNRTGKRPLYYAGGTEIISMARVNNLNFGAVIDIKGIPECNSFGFNNGKLIIGGAVTLSNITESKRFPLLGLTVARIADHTIQDKITLSGNLCGTIIYKEAVLPLLVSESKAVIASASGIRKAALPEVFKRKLNLNRGELLLQIETDAEYVNLPYVHMKKTKNEKIDYPLVTVSGLIKDGRLRLAFSGVCQYPFRSLEIESALNDNSLTIEERINKTMDNLPDKVLGDVSGSSEYRRFVLKNTLYNTLKVSEKV